MRRAVLDPNVFISALISPVGTSAMLVAQAHGGGFELVVSPQVLSELQIVLSRRKFRRYAKVAQVEDYLAFLHRLATVARDPDKPAPVACRDASDDYLLNLAFAQKAVLVTGDSHLLDIGRGAPICAPADFLAS